MDLSRLCPLPGLGWISPRRGSPFFLDFSLSTRMILDGIIPASSCFIAILLANDGSRNSVRVAPFACQDDNRPVPSSMPTSYAYVSIIISIGEGRWDEKKKRLVIVHADGRDKMWMVLSMRFDSIRCDAMRCDATRTSPFFLSSFWLSSPHHLPSPAQRRTHHQGSLLGRCVSSRHDQSPFGAALASMHQGTRTRV